MFSKYAISNKNNKSIYNAPTLTIAIPGLYINKHPCTRLSVYKHTK